MLRYIGVRLGGQDLAATDGNLIAAVVRSHLQYCQKQWGKWFFKSYERIANDLGISERSVVTAVAVLRARKLLTTRQSMYESGPQIWTQSGPRILPGERGTTLRLSTDNFAFEQGQLCVT